MRIWIFTLLALGLGTTAWAQETKPYPYMGKVVVQTVQVKYGDREVTRLQSGEEVIVLEKQGTRLKLALRNRVTVYVEGKYVRAGKTGAGVITDNRVEVRLFHNNKKVLGQLHKGDRFRVMGRKGPLYAIRSPQIIVPAYVPAKAIKRTGSKVSHQLARKIKTSRHLRPSWVPQAKELRALYQKEMAKSLENMDWKKFILKCAVVENGEHTPQPLKLVARKLREKALKVAKMRMKYLKLTNPIEKKINKHLRKK